MKRGLRWAVAVVLSGGLAAAPGPKPDATHRVPMRDGARLATDIYLPPEGEGPFPCILMRTPYGRTRYNVELGSMAGQGYAIAIQDLRGRFDSEGKAMAFQADGWGELQDGYDTVEWLARQDFCNGKVGTVGASAMGITQNMLAPTAPPSLACQYIIFAPANQYAEAAYPGGVLRKKQVEGYLGGQAHSDALKLVLAHPEYDEHWMQYDSSREAGRVRVPAVHVGGWFDTFCEGTLNGFVARQHRGGAGALGRQKLVVGPWTHGGPGKTKFGEFQLPKAARTIPVSSGAWFAHYLRAQENGIDDTAPVTYYVMGPLDGSSPAGNRWKTAPDWPVPSDAVSWSLTGAGGLVRGLEERPISEVTFSHNPADPVPTLGGRNLYLPAGPVDQRPIERREDVLTFTSAVLVEDLEIAGKVRARLRLAVSAARSVVALRLCDVYPDGRSILIAEGIRRCSATDGSCEVDVDLWSTALVFPRGHRIRLSVSGSNYPRWEVEPGDGVSQIKLELGGGNPSRLTLPVSRLQR